MISLYELQPGSLLCYGNMAAKVCMLDLVDESMMIALENGQHKMVGKNDMYLLLPMPINNKALQFLPSFKRGMASLRMAGKDLFLKAEKEALVLQDKDEQQVMQFSNVLSVHQLQSMYRLLTGAFLAVSFEHFLQEV